MKRTCIIHGHPDCRQCGRVPLSFDTPLWMTVSIYLIGTVVALLCISAIIKTLGGTL